MYYTYLCTSKRQFKSSQFKYGPNASDANARLQKSRLPRRIAFPIFKSFFLNQRRSFGW